MSARRSRANPRARRTVVSLLLLTLYAQGATSQDHDLRNYSAEDGLQSQVWDILQDQRGYMWFATMDGISRFDGTTFTNFSLAEGLASSQTRALAEDALGNIWIATTLGLSRYDGASFVTYTTQDGLPANETTDVLIDRQGTVWVGTTKGAARLDGYRFTAVGGPIQVRALFEDRDGAVWVGSVSGLFRSDSTGFTRVGQLAAIRDVAQDARGHLWIGTDNGLVRYDGSSFRTFGTQEGLSDKLIQTVATGPDGRIWVGSRTGLDLIDGDEIVRFRASELEHASVMAIDVDRERNVWIGTDIDGVFLDTGRPFTHMDTDHGLAGNVVWGIASDRGGGLWFASRGGASRWDGVAFKNYTTAEGLISNDVRAIHVDSRSRIWFGTDLGVSRMDGESVDVVTVQGEPLGKVTNIRGTPSGAIWVTTLTGAVRFANGQAQVFDSDNGLPFDAVWDVLEEESGDVWFGGPGGLHHWDGANTTSYTKLHGLSHDLVSVILRDPIEGFWIGSYEGGVNRFIPGQNGQPAHFDWFRSSDGLADDSVLLMEFDGAGHLVVGTNRGLSRIDVPAYRENGTKTIRSYGQKTGFSGVEVNHHAVYRDAQGRLWIGHVSGASRYDPARDEPSTVAPRTHVTTVRLFFETQDFSRNSQGLDSDGLPKGLVLPHDQNHLTFDVLGLSFVAPEEVRYRYYLRGADRDWSPDSDQRFVTYSNLRPGSYRFLVKARNSDGVWNAEPTAFAFEILPPFWLRTWFLGLWGLLATAAGYWFVTARARALAKRNRHLEEQVAERTSELQHEIREHEATSEALKRGEEKYRYMVEQIHDVMFTVSSEGCFTYLSPAAEPLLGVDPEKLIGKPLWNILQEADREHGALSLGRALAGDTVADDYRILRADGEIRWIRISKKASAPDASPVVVRGVLTDVTEQKDLEVHLAQARRLESIGQLAAGIAHEINTPLQFASSNMAFLQESFADILDVQARLGTLPDLLRSGSAASRESALEGIEQFVADLEREMTQMDFAEVLAEIPEALDESLKGLQRVGEIVGAMKDFSRPGSQQTTLEDLEPIVRNAVVVCRNTWRDVAELTIDLTPDAPRVLCSVGELGQVLVDLIVNATRAIEETNRPGEITIRSRTVDDSVELEIADNGCGMSDEVKTRVFEPFFTTREVGSGTGQGLTAARRIIVNGHGGSIHVESELGRGSRFTVRLPVAGESVSAA